MKHAFLLAIILFVVPWVTFAHPGSTDINGRHYCWTNCAYWGEIYGVQHSHYRQNYSTPVVTFEYEDLQKMFSDSEGYKKIKNGFKVGTMTYCKDGYEKSVDKCEKNIKELNVDSSVSLNDPTANQTLRIRNSLEEKKYSILDDFRKNDWKKYKKIILELVPSKVLLEKAPSWFLEENEVSSIENHGNLKERINYLTKLLNQLLAVRATSLDRPSE